MPSCIADLAQGLEQVRIGITVDQRDLLIDRLAQIVKNSPVAESAFGDKGRLMVSKAVSRETCHRPFQFYVQGSRRNTLAPPNFASPSRGAPFEPSLIGFDNAARVKKFRLTQTRSD